MKWLEQFIEILYRLFKPILTKEQKAQTQLEIQEKVNEANRIIEDLSPDQRNAILNRLRRRDGSSSSNGD